jgi:hypothetical protein
LLQYLTGINPNKALAWVRERPHFTCSCGGVMRIIKTMIPQLLRFMYIPKLTGKETIQLM